MAIFKIQQDKRGSQASPAACGQLGRLQESQIQAAASPSSPAGAGVPCPFEQLHVTSESIEQMLLISC